MRKLLILISIIASSFLLACSNDPIVARLPFVYKLDIQQGNVITREQVDQLQVGMNRRQVQFVIGAPMITDPFHNDRWDYYYSLQPGSGSKTIASERVTLQFSGDKLVRIDNTLEPVEEDSAAVPHRQVIVDVPYQEQEAVGILTRLWRWLTFQNKGET